MTSGDVAIGRSAGLPVRTSALIGRFSRGVKDPARLAPRGPQSVYGPVRPLRIACQAACRGPKTSDGGSPDIGSAPDDQRFAAAAGEIELTARKARSRLRPHRYYTHRGGCHEGTRCADPVDGRHARCSRTSQTGRLRSGLPAAVVANLESSPSGISARWRLAVPGGASGMKKAPQRGASRSNPIGLGSRPDDGQSSGRSTRDRRCGAFADGHFTYGARR
jgi:hypothetical protein